MEDYFKEPDDILVHIGAQDLGFAHTYTCDWGGVIPWQRAIERKQGPPTCLRCIGLERVARL